MRGVIQTIREMDSVIGFSRKSGFRVKDEIKIIMDDSLMQEGDYNKLVSALESEKNLKWKITIKTKK